jgi:DNA-directed RNA polymerase specialized sigma subunit
MRPRSKPLLEPSLGKPKNTSGDPIDVSYAFSIRRGFFSTIHPVTLQSKHNHDERSQWTVSGQPEWHQCRQWHIEITQNALETSLSEIDRNVRVLRTCEQKVQSAIIKLRGVAQMEY